MSVPPHHIRSRRRTFDSLPLDHASSAPRVNKVARSHAAGAIQLPIKVYFRYGSHERISVYDSRPVDTASAHSQHTYAEAAIFHHDAQRNTIRLVVLKGRPQDVGCVYSSAAQAATCIRARACSNEHCYLDLRGAQTLNQQRGFIERLVNCPSFADAATTCDTLASLCLPHPQYLAFVEAHPHVGSRRDPVSVAQSSATSASASSRVSGIVYRFPDLRLSASELARVAAVVDKEVCRLCPSCIAPVDSRTHHANANGNTDAASDPAFVCSVCAQSYHFSCQHITDAEIDDGFDYTCIGCVADPDSLFSSSVAITRGRKAEAARAGKRNLKVYVLPQISRKHVLCNASFVF